MAGFSRGVWGRVPVAGVSGQFQRRAAAAAKTTVCKPSRATVVGWAGQGAGETLGAAVAGVGCDDAVCCRAGTLRMDSPEAIGRCSLDQRAAPTITATVAMLVTQGNVARGRVEKFSMLKSICALLDRLKAPRAHRQGVGPPIQGGDWRLS